MNRMSACVDGLIACCQVLRRIDRQTEITPRLSRKLINLIATTLRNYATPSEKARGINFFIRKKSPRKTISPKERTTGGDARDRIGFIKYFSRKRTMSGGRGRGVLFECRSRSAQDDWKWLETSKQGTSQDCYPKGGWMVRESSCMRKGSPLIRSSRSHVSISPRIRRTDRPLQPKDRREWLQSRS